MKPLTPPTTITVYMLLKQSGVTLTPVRSMSVNNLGTGVFSTREEAEMNATLERLADTTTAAIKPQWHIFELELPIAHISKDGK